MKLGGGLDGRSAWSVEVFLPSLGLILPRSYPVFQKCIWGFLGVPWRLTEVCNRQVVALNGPNKCAKAQGVAPAHTAGISSIWSRVKLVKRAAVGAERVRALCSAPNIFNPHGRGCRHYIPILGHRGYASRVAGPPAHAGYSIAVSRCYQPEMKVHRGFVSKTYCCRLYGTFVAAL